MAREHFEVSAPVDEAPHKPRIRAYPCLAHGCPMPGAIFLNGHDAPGICSLHLNSTASTMPRITEVLKNWQCVAATLETVRRFLTDPKTCTDVKGETRLMAAQWRELALAAPGWDQLEPEPKSTLSEWARKLFFFLVWRVNSEVNGADVAWCWPPADTRTVAAMKRAIRQAEVQA